MKKYFFKNKINLVLYTLLAIIIYIIVTKIYSMYGLITSVVESNDYSRVNEVIIKSVVIFAALLILAIFQAFLNRYMLSNITNTIRKDLFDKVYRLNYSNFSKRDTTYYVSMIFNDVQILEENYFAKIFEFINDIFQVLVMLVTIALIGWKYVFITLLFLVFTVIQPFILKKKIANEGLNTSNELKKYTGVAQETINGFSTIKGVGRITNSIKHFNNVTMRLEDANIKLWNVKALNAMLTMLAVNILRVGGQLYFVNSAINGAIDAAIVVTLLGLLMNVGNPLIFLIRHVEFISSTKDIRKKITNFLNENVQEENVGNKVYNFSSIVFDDVSFSYDNSRKILNGLNLTIEKGKKYAFIGESGCGKSTILKLLMGYYKEYEGDILFNDCNIKDVSEDSYKSNISYLTQKAYIYSDTIENNICLEDKNYIDSELKNVIDKVQLKEVMDNISSKDYNIKDFSGGEKQRVALARALYANKEVILIDEGTSALDNIKATEVEKKLLQDDTKTVVSIVHRFNDSIKLYDKIFYIENGHVAESGSYDELINLNGKSSRIILGKGNA